jgi:riboflavin synthase
MFTGIIESLGTISNIEKEGTNIHFTIASSISKELKIDQSLAHEGVCLTVTSQNVDNHTVTAIEETLSKTNLGQWKIGNTVNLERAMLANARLDGHIVQGHVDITGVCIVREDHNGSWLYTFRYERPPQSRLSLDVVPSYFVIPKGSICINGVSLTVVNPVDDTFSVAIIPYTFEHTTFKNIHVGDVVNLEFDVIGKYITKYFEAYKTYMK